jgi:hypothetical protein
MMIFCQVYFYGTMVFCVKQRAFVNKKNMYKNKYKPKLFNV